MYIVPPWVPTFEACLTQAAKPHTFSLATVTKSGLPRVRTCVCRGWLFDDKSTGVLLFTTDARSQKVAELTSSDAFEACFYFPRKVKVQDDSYLRSASTDSLDSSSSNSDISETSQKHRKRTPGIQFRLSGFAQCISPSHGFYPTLSPLNNNNNNNNLGQSLDLNNNSSTSLSSSSTSSSTHISYTSNPDPHSYPIHSPNYVHLYRDQVRNSEHEVHNPTHSYSGLFEGTGNIIPIPKDKDTKKSSSSDQASSNTAASNTQNASLTLPSSSSTDNLDQHNNHSSLSYPPPPPSQAEWDTEYHRLWSGLSPAAKSSFRRPNPGAVLDDENRRKLDKLVRGVDGSSDARGLSNFVVVAMFINDADVLVDGTGAAHRRSKAHRVMEDDWVEDEVCP